MENWAAVLAGIPQTLIDDNSDELCVFNMCSFDIGQEAGLRTYGSLCLGEQPIPLGINVTQYYQIRPVRATKLVGLTARRLHQVNENQITSGS